MRDTVALVLSIALPWLAGMLGVLALGARRSQVGWLLVAGYGYPLGAFAATLVLRAHDSIGLRWTLAAIAASMLALIAVLLWPARNAWRAPPEPGREGSQEGSRQAPLPMPLRALCAACLALIVVRLASLAAEIAWRPLLPWDAWAHWATKAKVWFTFGAMPPFVTQAQWLAAGDPMRFIDVNPHYPATVPLLQVWTNLWLGRWDESLMNAPWLAIAVALGLAFHAQLRRARIDAASALVCTYLLLSLPFLDLHVALAGVADVFVATAYSMAAMALWSWTRTRARIDLALAVAMTVMLVTVKVEGRLWALTLVAPLIVALHRRAGLGSFAALAGAAILYLAYGPAEITLFGYVLRTRFENVWRPLAQHMFVMDNWHLFWYAAIGVIAWRARRLLAPEHAVMTVTLAGALGFVFVVFFFSSAAGGVEDESLVNRLLLHMVPALAFYLALLVCEPCAGAHVRSAQHQAKAADA